MDVHELVDQVLQRTPQPVVDNLMWLLQRGAWDRAVEALLESEGHWLLAHEALQFVAHAQDTIQAARARGQPI